jgi:uncharacterized membrane protein
MEDFVIAILCVAVLYLLVLHWTRAKRLNDLQSRLDLLERSARQSPPPAIAPTPSTPSPILPFRPPAPLQTPPYTSPTPVRRQSIEERLGQNWLNKLGIVILVIGLALFLGYQLRTWGPLGKSLIGLTLSLAILGGGVLLERRSQYRLFARAAIGGGWALTFFVIFAFYHVRAMQVLHSQLTDLTLMLLVAAGMVAHSLLYKSQTVTTLAFLLAFITVGISDITLFSLVASVLLAIALIYVAARESWFALALAGLLGLYLTHFLWLHRVLPNGASPAHPFPQFLSSVGLLFLYWLLFRILYFYRVPTTRDQATLASLTAIANSIGLLSLLKFQSTHPEWAFYGLLALGVAEFLLAFIARRARPTYSAPFILLSTIASVLLLADTHPHTTHLAVTLFAATLLFWFNAELSPLLWPSRWEFKSQSALDLTLLRVTSFLATISAALALQLLIPSIWITLSWTALALLCLTLGWSLQRPSFVVQSIAALFAATLRYILLTLPHLPALAGIPSLAVRAAPPALMLLSLPIAFAIRRQRAQQSTFAQSLLTHPEQPFFFAPLLLLTLLLAVDLRAGMIPIGWAALGVLVFFFALAVKVRSFRLAGLALLLLAVAKTLLIDIWHAKPTDRYITLIVIGAALLLVSFLYSRYRETLLKFL